MDHSQRIVQACRAVQRFQGRGVMTVMRALATTHGTHSANALAFRLIAPVYRVDPPCRGRHAMMVILQRVRMSMGRIVHVLVFPWIVPVCLVVRWWLEAHVTMAWC